MAKNDYSEYQKTVISGYYNNLDTIMLGKLSELVSELYLAETPSTPAQPCARRRPECSEGPNQLNPKQTRLWERVHKAMIKLKIPPAIIDHIMKKQDVQILAKNLQDWQNITRKR